MRPRGRRNANAAVNFNGAATVSSAVLLFSRGVVLWGGGRAVWVDAIVGPQGTLAVCGCFPRGEGGGSCGSS